MLAVLIFLFLQPMCTSMMPNQSYEISELNTVSDQVIVDFAKKMQKKGFYGCGFGGEEEHGKIKAFQISFQYNSSLDIPLARHFIVEMVQLFLEEINNKELVQKYLVSFPFAAENVKIGIFAINQNIESKNNVAVVSASFGKIYYYTKDEQQIGPLADLHEETFEDAVKILEREKTIK